MKKRHHIGGGVAHRKHVLAKRRASLLRAKKHPRTAGWELVALDRLARKAIPAARKHGKLRRHLVGKYARKLEVFVATAVDSRGNVVGTWESTNPKAAMASADAAASPGTYVSVAGEKTSDGTRWGKGKGRVVAQREGGRWRVG